LIARAAAVAGIGFCLLGVGSSVYFPHFRKHALQANGVVKNLIRDEDNGTVHFCAEFSFQTPDSKTFIVDSHTCSHPSEFSVGQPVEVLYMPNDPNDAFIDSPGQFSGLATWELEIGAVSLLIAVSLFWYAKRAGIPIRWLDGWCD
jgi:hypothetical protein